MVYDIIRKLPADLKTLAHEGIKAYGDAFELIHRREADRPNAIWQADHTLFDIGLVKDDGTTARPWPTVIADDYSRAVAGYSLYFEAPITPQTALALRQALSPELLQVIEGRGSATPLGAGRTNPTGSRKEL